MRLHGPHIPRGEETQRLCALSRGRCVSCSGSCSSCPSAHFSVKVGHSPVVSKSCLHVGEGSTFSLIAVANGFP